MSAFCGAGTLIDRHSPSADQHVLAAFIAEGHLERHIRRIRGVYADRRAQLIAMLARWIPKELGWLQPSDQGMHLVLWLAKEINDECAASRALESGVAVRAVSPMYSPGKRMASIAKLAVVIVLHDPRVVRPGLCQKCAPPSHAHRYTEWILVGGGDECGACVPSHSDAGVDVDVDVDARIVDGNTNHAIFASHALQKVLSR